MTFIHLEDWYGEFHWSRGLVRRLSYLYMPFEVVYTPLQVVYMPLHTLHMPLHTLLWTWKLTDLTILRCKINENYRDFEMKSRRKLTVYFEISDNYICKKQEPSCNDLFYPVPVGPTWFLSCNRLLCSSFNKSTK